MHLTNMIKYMEEDFTGKSSYHLELIKKYFGGIEDEIKDAANRFIAEEIITEKLEKFNSECESEIIKGTLKKLVMDILIKYHGL